MKTSNKWLLAALLLLLGSLTAYNRDLRAEYARGAYKNPLLSTTALNFKDFTEVDVPAASRLGVRVVAGPYGVRVNKAAEKYVRVTQQGTRLIVALAFPEDVKHMERTEAVTISLPRLRQLTAGGAYSAAGKLLTERQGQGGHVQIDGFRQDSLRVQPDLGAPQPDRQSARLPACRCRPHPRQPPCAVPRRPQPHWGRRPARAEPGRVAARNRRHRAAAHRVWRQRPRHPQRGGAAQSGAAVTTSFPVTSRLCPRWKPSWTSCTGGFGGGRR